MGRRHRRILWSGGAGFQPKRRTMVQLRIGRSALKICRWLMTPTGDSISRARAIGQFGSARTTKFPATLATPHPKRSTSRPPLRGSKAWSTGRSSASSAAGQDSGRSRPDRLPVYGFDPHVPSFFWCAGQGGFGIQTSPAAATMAAAQLLDEEPDATVAHIDPAVFSPARFV
jgi:Glycine/D-amino acid oxidases (deaminating)